MGFSVARGARRHQKVNKNYQLLIALVQGSAAFVAAYLLLKLLKLA